MKKIIRRVIAVLLIVTAGLMILIPADESYASVTVGDFEIDGSTVIKYNGDDTNVTLPNTVTKIGKGAFAGNTGIVKVTIPDSVKEIDFASFENCINLEYVSLPDSIRTIGSSAFSGCSSLYYINIPEKTSSIGSAAFARCNSLSTVYIDPSNLYYTCDDGVIYSKDYTKVIQYLAGRLDTSYYMPETVNKIEEYAFWGAGNLTSCMISENVKEIPEYAFDNCSGLTYMSIPYGIESLMAFSFADCTSLRNIVIPDSVGYIDENAFYRSHPENVDFTNSNGNSSDMISSVNGSASGSLSDNDINSTDGNLLHKDYNGNFVYFNTNPYVSSMTADYSDNVNPGEIGSTKIVGGSALVIMPSDVTIKGYDVFDAEGEDSVAASGNITTFSDDEFTIINNVLCHYNGNDSVVNIPDGVTEIGDRVFYKNDKIKSVNIPGSVNTIGDFAFARSSLESVDIPSGVADIEYAAFYQCEKLSDVKVSDNVDNIEMGAFDGTKWLNNWKNDAEANDFLLVGNGILLAYKGEDSNVIIPPGVKSVGRQSFYNNRFLENVELPNSILNIGEDAFNGCVKLNNVNLPESLIIIEDRAFKNTGLKDVVIPSSVVSIGLGAFDNTGNSEVLKTVMFMGDTIPYLSGKPTSNRLSADDLRSMAFNGIKNAVITENAVENLNYDNVLSENKYGFRGQIYVIKENGTPGKAELVKSTVEPDVYNAVKLSSSFSINGNDYNMSGVREHAFDSYDNVELWSGKKMFSIDISGNTSDDLNKLLDNVTLSDATLLNDSDDEAIKVEIYGKDFPAQFSSNAVIENNDGKYTLTISENEFLEDSLKTAFYSAYGSVNDLDIIPLSIDLIDKKTGIYIKKLASGKLIVTIPVPLTMNGIDNIKVATLDDNGALEIVSSERININGQDSIKFIASHLSPYAIYYQIRNKDSEIIDGEMISVINNDTFFTSNSNNVVVKSLHKKVGTIEAKWFVIVILFSLAMILLLWKDNKKRKYK